MAGRKGRSGRRRLPAAAKKARGTYRPSRDKKGAVENVLEAHAPGEPAWLGGEALEEWRRIVPILEKVKVLNEMDQQLLAAYCSAAGISVQAQKIVNRDGIMPRRSTAKGKRLYVVHPMIKVAQEARAQALRFAIEFGLTPASRSRVVVGAGAVVPPGAPRAAYGQRKAEQREGGAALDAAERFILEAPQLDARH